MDRLTDVALTRANLACATLSLDDQWRTPWGLLNAAGWAATVVAWEMIR